MKRFLFLCLGFLTLAGTACAPTAQAGNDAVYTSWRNNVAVDGYDPVSFFMGKPLKGNPDFKTSYQGADWHFSSRAHLDLFETNPSVFAPQYGGYCAWAVAMGKLAKGNPDNWHVKDGKLFLNFNSRIQEKWDNDRVNLIQKANENWPEIIDK